MGTAGVGPHIGKGDLLSGTLLEEQTLLRVEEEDRERSVQETLVDIRHKMACART